MLSGSKKGSSINVAIITRYLAGWTGGVNYLRNLLIAVHSIENSRLNIVLFSGTDENDFRGLHFDRFSTIVRSRLFNKGKIWNHKWLTRYFRKIKDRLVWRKLESFHIRLISHSFYHRQGCPIKTLNWIPDFQHIHLQDMFDKKEINNRNVKFQTLIQQSDGVLLSSEDARNDANRFLPGYNGKYKVLNFVSIPEDDVATDIKNEIKEINCKYHVADKYFYLPNQFWKHKNHIVVFKAIKILKDKELPVRVLCTGDIKDYRNTGYMAQLYNYISKNNLDQNIFILGKIPYKDVFVFMRAAIAIINPSLFEGWSSTVEEAKSINQHLIISNIPVHREQAPDSCDYFQPHSAEDLACILKRCWVEFTPQSRELLDSNSELLKQRIFQFGKNYEEIVTGLLDNYLPDE